MVIAHVQQGTTLTHSLVPSAESAWGVREAEWEPALDMDTQRWGWGGVGCLLQGLGA